MGNLASIVWSALANVLPALGCEGVSLRTPQRDFGTALSHFFLGTLLSSKRVRSTAALHLHQVGIMFSDFDVVSSRQSGYWASNPVPHVFTCASSDTLSIPEGWASRQKEFRQADLGGATTGVYCLSLLVLAPSDRLFSDNGALADDSIFFFWITLRSGRR